jgi:3-deoxy-D-manno-octulosonate 8-phosphate phosphatase (KDO 8-P phosphatase)
MGDDLPDLPMFSVVGLATAPANAVADVKERAHHVTLNSGGRGAVRELIEMIMRNQGTWGTAVAEYLDAKARLEQ